MPSQSEPDLPEAVEPRGSRDIGTAMQTAIHSLPLSAGPAPPDNRDFDRWLRRELGRLHNDVLHEPIPDRLLRIIEASDSARRG